MSDAPGRTGLEDPRPLAVDRPRPADDTAGRAAPPAATAAVTDGEPRVARNTVVETAVQPRLNLRRLGLLAAAGVGLLVLIAGVLYWRTNAGLVKTDNAQTAGDLAPVSSRISGTVVRVRVAENQYVTAGTPLVELDETDYQLALNRARASLSAAQAQVRALEAALGVQEQQFQAGLRVAQAQVQATQPTVSQAQAQLDLQDRTTAAQVVQANARVTTAAAAVTAAKIAADTAARTLERDRRLLAQGALAQQQVDVEASAYELARAQYQAAQDALAHARADVAAAQAARQQVVIARNAISVSQGQLSGARAQMQQAAAGGSLVRQRASELAVTQAQAAEAAEMVRTAELNLGRTIIRAPADGWVTNRTVQVGQVIQPNQPLLSVALSQGVWVVANVKETALGSIRPGQPVRVTIDAYRGRRYRGRVESIGSATGSATALLPPDNATGNFVKVVQLVPVRITLDPAEVRSRPLQIGLSAEVAIDTRRAVR